MSEYIVFYCVLLIIRIFPTHKKHFAMIDINGMAKKRMIIKEIFEFISISTLFFNQASNKNTKG
jgi:hypothetical protein